ncbi:MAG: murein hydrolase activator EnvC family protein, partial [Steroidobacteraceae bacterium]
MRAEHAPHAHSATRARATATACAWALAALLGWQLAGHRTAAAPTEEQAQERLERLKTQIADVERRVGAAASERDSAARQLRATEHDVARAHQLLDEIRVRQRASEARRNTLEAERKTYEKTLDKERAALASQLRAAYLIGREEPLKLLLNQHDPATLGRMLAYYSYFGRARADQIELIRMAVVKLDSLEVEVDEENRHLDELASEQQRQVEALEAARTQRSAALATVREKLQSRSARLDSLKSQANTLTKLLEELRRALRDFPIDRQESFAKLRGQLAWPVQGQVLADYGE